ncbi:MAG: prepilin-type N-terminal cleavage/methylation domain-containing protein [Phycisphaerales bacterium]
MIRRAASNPIRFRRAGFTLVELLVAVAIVGLLTVGIAQVFSLTGKTVASGRRLSTLNTYATIIERQLRADIAGISREGFMVMRHQLVQDSIDDARGVQLSPGDERPRDRRADELVFFARGDFQTAREPLHPSRVARSDVARIYYGHGLRGTNAATTLPQVDDPPTTAAPSGLGERINSPGQTLPNQYAGDWTLLRNVCLLAVPRAGNQPLPTLAANYAYLLAPNKWNDRDAQVALQPGAVSIFRTVALGSSLPASNTLVRAGRRPMLASGLVDVVTTDLSEVRGFVNGAPPPALLNSAAAITALTQFFAFTGADATEPAWSGMLARERMQAWMRDALPADSDGLGPTGTPQRMRYEPRPPNFSGEGLSWGASDVDFRRADQLMLSASNFVPRCSEFMVEWSFGQVEPGTGIPGEGRVLWHGLEREVRISGAAAFDNLVDYRVRPYGQGPTGPRALPTLPADPLGELAGQVYTLNTGAQAQRAISPLLIHSDETGTSPPPAINMRLGPLYSYFGYVDPMFDPAPEFALAPTDPQAAKRDFLVDVQPPAPTAFPTYDPLVGDRLVQPDTVEWAWPKLIRITLRMVDPADSSTEQTYQFVLPLPERGRGIE